MQKKIVLITKQLRKLNAMNNNNYMYINIVKLLQHEYILVMLLSERYDTVLRIYFRVLCNVLCIHLLLQQAISEQIWFSLAFRSGQIGFSILDKTLALGAWRSKRQSWAAPCNDTSSLASWWSGKNRMKPHNGYS